MKEFLINIKASTTAELKADLLCLLEELNSVQDFVETSIIDKEIVVTGQLIIQRME